jgi:hypothetical protein
LQWKFDQPIRLERDAPGAAESQGADEISNMDGLPGLARAYLPRRRIGSLKKRTQRAAYLAGHAEQWTTADLDRVRHCANLLTITRRRIPQTFYGQKVADIC